MSGREQKLEAQFNRCNDQLKLCIAEAKQAAMADFGTAAAQQTWSDCGAGRRAPRGLTDVNGIKIQKILEAMTTEGFGKCKHDLMMYVGGIPSWIRGSHILKGTRVHGLKMDWDQWSSW